MNQRIFKITGNSLRVLHIESPRTGFYQLGGILIFIYTFVMLLDLIRSLINHEQALIFFNRISFLDTLFLLVFIVFPLLLIIFAQRFPPAPIVIFHSDTQKVQWLCMKKTIEVPFQKVTFSPVRMPTKTGISNVFVMVSAIADKPFFENEKCNNEPGGFYKKDLCLYKAGTQDDADRSIEIIQMFMSEKWEAYSAPSKFDVI